MTRIQVLPLHDGADSFRTFVDDMMLVDPAATLRRIFDERPFLATTKLDERVMETALADVQIELIRFHPAIALYGPPGWMPKSLPAPLRAAEAAQQPVRAAQDATAPARSGKREAKPPAWRTAHPATISDAEAALLAYGEDVARVASFLRSNLSVLVLCEKLVVEYLWNRMVLEALRRPVLLEVSEEDGGEPGSRGLRQRQLARLKTLIKTLKDGDVLVIRHLDLLAGGGETNLSTESREMIELVYQAKNQVLLAFADRSLEIPEVLAARFAVRMELLGLHKDVVHPNGDYQSVGQALVTESEAARFRGFNPEALYKNVAGMNPVRFRQALRYAIDEFASKDETAPVEQLYEAIRTFKAQTSAKFEVPNVTFEHIGGYEEVKHALLQALEIMAGFGRLPSEELRRELIPRGFLFYGPPGTGKTLFAKAVANQMKATIQIVSGPEVTDMYVGESERKVRELFAEARRNAPSVLVFDEFDSIAAKRSGRDDGGSRAGNALVAQILTEMDGFRPDVPMLVIGTTNRLDIVDDALLRPSRFRPISIGLPEKPARRAIAEVHAEHFGIPVTPELLGLIADYTDEFNGDEIRSLFRDACVGQFCQDPPLTADARRIGYLVGKIRQDLQKRQAELDNRRSGQTQRLRQGDTAAADQTTFRPLTGATPPNIPENILENTLANTLEHHRTEPPIS